MICRKCNVKMSHRDYVKRLIRIDYGRKQWIIIERFICPVCNTVHRNLPDNVLPFKHYTKNIVEGVLDGTITPDILGYEDYPTENTMKRWKNAENREK